MIPLRVKGKPSHITETLVGRVTRNVANLDEHSILVHEGKTQIEEPLPEIVALLSTHNGTLNQNNISSVSAVSDLTHLNEGDIVSIDARGNIHSLYRINSSHNSILVTERCNSKCLMCSQPPKVKDDIDYLSHIHEKLIPLIPKSCQYLGITGGEPALLGDRLLKLLQLLQNELPQTEVHILTNGRNLSDWNYVQNLSRYCSNQISFGIPVYSDYFAMHDYIVQAESAFAQTMTGLHNLARLHQRVEVRIVLHKLSVTRLVKLARFIYKNLPFVEHVAFMGLEHTGYTPHNLNLIGIEPHDYMDMLTEAVLYLDSFHIPVSLYNLQLCILPKILWNFSRKSISDWKNVYLPVCNKCEVKDRCGGFFDSSKEVRSNDINPISLDS